jgi:hypothetical protein
MRDSTARDTAEGAAAKDSAPGSPGLGKRTLTGRLVHRPSDGATASPPAVQRRATVSQPAANEPSAIPGGLAEAFDTTDRIHASATAGVATPSQELPFREELEPALGRDLSFVRAHMGGTAEESAHAIDAEAYARGDDVVLPTNPSMHTVAHEVTHVLQQRGNEVQFAGGIGEAGDSYEQHADVVADRIVRGESAADLVPAAAASASPATNVVQRQEAPDAGVYDGPVDAGVPLPAGVVDPTPRPPAQALQDFELGSELAHAEQLALSGSPDRQREVEDEIERRIPGIIVESSGSSPATAANTNVTPEVAVNILDNVSRGQPPFKPELGKGGASWFVSEGDPFTGIDPAKNVTVDVEVTKGSKPVTFAESQLLGLLDEAAKETAVEAEKTFRARFGLEDGAPLNSKMRKALARFQQQFAESRMWNKVAERVRSSPDGVGEVILEPGSRFSRSGSGKFIVVADATKVQVKGGVEGLTESLTRQGVSAEAPILEAAEALAKKMKWAGRVRAAFRYGGRVLIVVAVAADAWKIYRAEDKTRAVIETVGGWAGATVGAAAFAAWFAPADTAGPWAWAAHGVGTLISGGIGYWVGSEATRTIYELVAEE